MSNTKETVKDLISENVDLLFRLNRAGIKNIPTALDYLLIKNCYDSYEKIEPLAERKKLTADRCHVSIRTVDLALATLKKLI